jgi:hypothetical protein
MGADNREPMVHLTSQGVSFALLQEQLPQWVKEGEIEASTSICCWKCSELRHRLRQSFIANQ